VVESGLKRICFYTSDYGYGHAARDIAVIRSICKQLDVKVYVKTDVPYEFMKHSLPSARVIRRRNDVGLTMCGNSSVADATKTCQAVDEWVGTWESYILEEKSFCESKGIDLILSDIVPQAFLVAQELGVPGIGISNFTWHYIFSNLLGETESVKRLEEAYRSGKSALVLPFNEEMGLFRSRKKISLVSREITRPRASLRMELGIQESDIVVYLGLGKSLGYAFLRHLKDIDAPGIRFLVSSGVELPHRNVIHIPDGENETQNYIAMCDLVVSKAGYSTASEAIKARVPMFLFRRAGYAEDELIVRGVESMGIGKGISGEKFLNSEWIEELDDLEGYQRKFDGLEARFRDDGLTEVVDAIGEALL
jgi:uncharacterized protein (TIGR00661 family)